MIVSSIFLQQGFTDGRETCGPSEQGKDCYFTKTSELTGTDVFVVQTKKGKVTKASSSKDNLDNIVTQLRTALSTIVVLITDKKKKVPLEGYLVASGEINESARVHIADQLSDPRLKFIDVETLIPLVDRHMPELWLDIEPDVISYFRAISTAIEQGGELLPGGLPVGQNNSNAGVLDDAYTSVNLIRAKPQRQVKGKHIPKKSDPRRFNPTLPATSLINERDRLILIQGDGGFGKTTALKRIAYELARRPLDSPKDVRVPVLLRAHDLAQERSTPLVEHATRRIRLLDPNLEQPFTLTDLQEGRVVFMIDGLDEVGTPKHMDNVIQMINECHSGHPRCQVIVTSRTTHYTSSSPQLQQFSRYMVAPFSVLQAQRIIKSLARQQSLGPEASSEILRQLQEVHGITLSPLIVTIFVAISDASKRDLPPNITELFKKYTELMLGRWDEGKKLDQQIQAPVKDLVLQQVEFRMHQMHQTNISVDHFKDMVYAELKSRGFIEETPTLYEEIVERSGLFRVDSDRIEFRHLLFQEFFAGRAITSSEYIALILEDDWWKLAIVFYFGEHPNDIESLQKLAHSLEKMSANHAFMTATTIGLALQACYFAHVDEKARVCSLLIRAIIEARNNPDFFARIHELPFVLLVTCFFIARDSLALSNLTLFVERVHNDLLNAYRDEPTKQEEVRFWFIVGLLESGLYDLAHVYIERFRTRADNATFFFALHLELINARIVKVISADAQAQLKELAKLVDSRMGSVAETLRNQIDHETRLLEKQMVEIAETAKKVEEHPSHSVGTPLATEIAEPEKSSND